MTENDISREIIGACIKIHRTLGPGLLESTYQQCLCYELEKLEYRIEREKPVPLIYEEMVIGCGYRIDILVEQKVVIELKSVRELDDIHAAQLLTYLKLGSYKLGLLINFNELLLKDGIRRIVNRL
jgi:GxxExxY protein